MTALAEAINADDVERTPDGLASAFGAHFDASGDSLMSLANASVQYVSVGEPPKTAEAYELYFSRRFASLRPL